MVRKRHAEKKEPVKLGIRAFTIRYQGIANRITTSIKLSKAYDFNNTPPDQHLPLFETTALWDTGATSSVITVNTANQLGLVSIGLQKINHAGGVGMTNSYLANFFLPNMVVVPGIQVIECPDSSSNFGAIIGMDIISKGDFTITNKVGMTCMTFRIPSVEVTDYVAEANALRKLREARK